MTALISRSSNTPEVHSATVLEIHVPSDCTYQQVIKYTRGTFCQRYMCPQTSLPEIHVCIHVLLDNSARNTSALRQFRRKNKTKKIKMSTAWWCIFEQQFSSVHAQNFCSRAAQCQFCQYNKYWSVILSTKILVYILYVQYGYAQQTTFITSFSFTAVCIKSSGGQLLLIAFKFYIALFSALEQTHCART